ncbi:MAG TPA: class I SAM-dependent methyltransferase [Terracidiphilus sp.]|jgi:2-polyprenyl-6-hydroxyphenyl methylase/3-demethylubiquinone-9 3-methyltransferase|nr:class I SAM-dependent methyltransferase [Terracidiphilus sp.]
METSLENTTTVEHAADIAAGRRFAFGKNWRSFSQSLADRQVHQAEHALQEMLGQNSLAGKRFLDVGSGSGLSSLAAHRLGAVVHSFDYDPEAVGCTRELKASHGGESGLRWEVEHGSALDTDYLASLGQFDVVYSWGVLHHTGDMWAALANVSSLVAPGGKLFVSIYNDQGASSDRWRRVKAVYNRAAPTSRSVLAVLSAAMLYWRPFLKGALRAKPLQFIRDYEGNGRGMLFWNDLIDWVGGYPFEVATREQISDFYQRRGFVLTRLHACDDTLGCNQFVFHKR